MSQDLEYFKTVFLALIETRGAGRKYLQRVLNNCIDSSDPAECAVKMAVSDLRVQSDLIARGQELKEHLKEKGVSLLLEHELSPRLRGTGWLFAQGRIELLQKPGYFFLGLVGSRNTQGDYQNLVRKTIKAFAECTELVVVSGLARGIDMVAHSVALELGIPTVSVLGYGIFHEYSTRKDYRKLRKRIPASGGLVISAYKPRELPRRSNFLERNQLIVKLSDLVVPVQGKVPSGTYSTVVKAVKMGKPILCLRNDEVIEIINYLENIHYEHRYILNSEEFDEIAAGNILRSIREAKSTNLKFNFAKEAE